LNECIEQWAAPFIPSRPSIYSGKLNHPNGQYITII